jgi:hypothetical protein
MNICNIGIHKYTHIPKNSETISVNQTLLLLFPIPPSVIIIVNMRPNQASPSSLLISAPSLSSLTLSPLS